MPRIARTKCESGIYHVILRGNAKMLLFEAETDRQYFLDKFRRDARECDIKCLAYVLMDNHVHLLLKDPDGKLDVLMKRVCVSYARHFNAKYARVGHVFQDRYKSENVETDEYLLTVYRYILKNPEKAGLGAASTYPWSSWNEYADKEGSPELSGIRELIGSEAQFFEFMQGGEKDFCMEKDRVALDDQEALQLITHLTGEKDPHAIRDMGRKRRDEVLRELKNAGMTVRQLERVTGIAYGVIQRA